MRKNAKEQVPASPSVACLKEIVLDSCRDLPLHAQLRMALERLIEERFEHESRFYSESQLISNLGVSQGTVRRALSELALRGVLEKRQARRTIVRKLPPEVAMRHLAVFLPDYSSPNVMKFLSHLNAKCMDRGVRMQPYYTHRGEHLLRAYDNLNFPARQGGVVLLENSPRATTELAAALGDKGYSCVVIDTLIEEPNYKYVGVSNASLVEIGLEYLTGLGHRRIALLVNEPEEKLTVQERIAAFEAWTTSRGGDLSTRIVHAGTQLWDDAYAAAQAAMPEVMAEPQPPTAIFAISDIGALAAINWLQQKGIRVPEEVSVMGTDGTDLGGMVHPTLTTLSSPVAEMIDAVFELLAEKEAKGRMVKFEPTLVARESTAPPRDR